MTQFLEVSINVIERIANLRQIAEERDATCEKTLPRGRPAETTGPSALAQAYSDAMGGGRPKAQAVTHRKEGSLLVGMLRVLVSHPSQAPETFRISTPEETKTNSHLRAGYNRTASEPAEPPTSKRMVVEAVNLAR